MRNLMLQNQTLKTPIILNKQIHIGTVYIDWKRNHSNNALLIIRSIFMYHDDQQLCTYIIQNTNVLVGTKTFVFITNKV